MVLAANPCPCGRHTLHGRRVRVPAVGDPALPGAAVRAAAGPGRSAGRGRAGQPRRPAGPGRPGRADGGRRGPGAGGQGACRGPARGAPRGRSTARCRAMSCVRAGRPRPGRWPRPSGTWSADCSPPAAWTGCCGSRGRSRTSPGATGPQAQRRRPGPGAAYRASRAARPMAGRRREGRDRDAGELRDGRAGSEERLARAALTRVSSRATSTAGGGCASSGPRELMAAAHLRRSTRTQALPGATAASGSAGYRIRAAAADPDARPGGGRRASAAGSSAPATRSGRRQLDDLGDARPIGLWVRGAADLRIWALRSVAVVGARACTPYGAHMAAEPRRRARRARLGGGLRARPTGSTAPRTAARSPRAGPPSPCSPAGSTSPIRAAMPS